jgi:hypothetical protein
VTTPAPSSPPASESFLSEFDGTAGSVIDTSYDAGWDTPTDAASLNIVSWKLGVNARVEDGIEKRGFNGKCLGAESCAALHLFGYGIH